MGASRLVLGLVITTAACGRLGFDADDAAVAPLCGSTTAVPGPVADPNVDLSFVPTPAGATAFWNLSSGSTLYGINLLPSLEPDAATTASPRAMLPLIYGSHSAAFVAPDLVVAPTELADPPRTFIIVMTADLSGYLETADRLGVAAEVSFTQFGAGRSFYVVAEAGLTRFDLDGAWSPTGSAATLAGAGGQWGAVATVADTELQVWGSSTACRVAWRSGQYVSGLMPECSRPRIAVAGSEIAMLFERDGVLRLGRGPVGFGPTLTAVATGTSGRIVHDGRAFWIAYLNAGRIRAGYLEGDTAITFDVGPAPGPDAFELAVVDGVPRLAMVEAGGLVVHTLCAP